MPISTSIMRVANIVILGLFLILITTHELTLGVASVYRVGLLVIVIIIVISYYYFIFIISP